jgi:EAL domain-containing protein (putative c-di-GMP-specific phosphodiesterase class I)
LEGLFDQPELATHFEKGLELLRVYYQPVVDVETRQLRGFRILGRSLHPLLPTFEALLGAADRLGRRRELRRKLWSLTAAPLEFMDPSLLLFVWTDVDGLTDAVELGALRERARQTVLMVSDRHGIEESAEAQSLLRRLRAEGYRLGIDQLGDGYAGLNALAWFEPEFLELESALVRRVASDPEQQRLVGALSALAKELGAIVTAAGVGDERDARALLPLGCNLFSWDSSATPDELAPFSAETVSELRDFGRATRVSGARGRTVL